MIVETTKVRLWNSSSGSTGSSTRHSTTGSTAHAIRVRPSQSIFVVSSCLGSLRAKRQATQATTPSGKLIQNTQRQEIESVSQPPSSGPSTEDTPNIAPIGAM